jgi:hypothetical protein
VAECEVLIAFKVNRKAADGAEQHPVLALFIQLSGNRANDDDRGRKRCSTLRNTV